MSFGSANPRQSQDRLKVLPGGSRDFHQVLHELLYSETLDAIRSSDEHVRERGNDKALIDIPFDKNNNNSSNRENPFFESNISTNLKCCLGQCDNQLYDLYTNERLTNLFYSKSCPDFPAFLKMGTTCSSNAYDHREWHNVADGCPLEQTKQSRRARKKQVPGKDVESNGVPAGPVCTCNATSADAVDANEVLTKTHTDKRSWLSLQNSPTDTQAHNQINNRLSPSVDSSGHIKLSRLFSSGRARATSSCDVSPHRLLTRRNNSPSGRSFTFDPRSSYSDALRQRSHSWSYSKYGNRPNCLKPASTVRASVLSPHGQKKMISSNSLQNTQNLGSQNKSTTPTKSSIQESCKKDAIVIHEVSCPLHVAACEAIRSDMSAGLDAFDTCLSPVMRQRSASESHTTRPRRVLPRPTTGASNGQEHVHVRWADEEDGSALSTSVLLSSIRPRSYSYGATDSAPHRPILKKVAGL